MKELSPPALNLKRLVKETVPGEPILIVISPGADPSHVSLLTRLFLLFENVTAGLGMKLSGDLFMSNQTLGIQQSTSSENNTVE